MKLPHVVPSNTSTTTTTLTTPDIDASIKPSYLSPLLKEAHALQAQHPDAVLLVQVGDFYEIYTGDVDRIASSLDLRIAVVKSKKPNEDKVKRFAGFPIHAATR